MTLSVTQVKVDLDGAAVRAYAYQQSEVEGVKRAIDFGQDVLMADQRGETRRVFYDALRAIQPKLSPFGAKGDVEKGLEAGGGEDACREAALIAKNVRPEEADTFSRKTHALRAAEKRRDALAKQEKDDAPSLPDQKAKATASAKVAENTKKELEVAKATVQDLLETAKTLQETNPDLANQKILEAAEAQKEEDRLRMENQAAAVKAMEDSDSLKKAEKKAKDDIAKMDKQAKEKITRLQNAIGAAILEYQKAG
ncbi:MAG: hypothetical protein AABY22_03070, partial [Nanoarchaeota archaeon]